jgi:hypothetical protein
MMLRPLRLAGTLWDSRATAPLPRRTGTGLPAELEPLLTCGTATGQAKENAKWVATENPATKLWNSANPRGFYPLWDGSGKTSPVVLEGHIIAGTFWGKA